MDVALTVNQKTSWSLNRAFLQIPRESVCRGKKFSVLAGKEFSKEIYVNHFYSCITCQNHARF